MKIAVVNCGGSSIKFQVLDMNDESCLLKSSVEQIGLERSVFKVRTFRGVSIKEDCIIPDYTAGMNKILSALTDKTVGVINNFSELAAIGHRVVHAGEKFTGSVVIDDAVIEALYECAEMAPLHNPPNIKGIEACLQVMPDIMQVGVFDNTLHRDLPPHVFLYGIPYEYYEKYGVRRYGFHGISFDYMTQRASELIGKKREDLRIVSLMLGSGCTANAMKHGKSVEVSTGFTPLEGLIQATRSGDIDSGAVAYLTRKLGINATEMESILNRKSGWLGISGVSPEFREVQEAAQGGHKRAKLALEAMAHRARKYIGSYMMVMGGIDMLVFGGGLGEKSSLIRKMICEGLEDFQIAIDHQVNDSLEMEGLIGQDGNRVKIAVVNTNEELVIARNVMQVQKQYAIEKIS